MQYSRFFEEILSGSKLIVSAEGLAKYEPYLLAHKNGQILDFPELPKITASYFDTVSNQIQEQLSNDKPEDSIAIIPLQGILTRGGSWWDYGTDEIAQLMQDMLDNPAVKGIVLRTNCLGGSVHSMNPIVSVMEKNRKGSNKPIIQAIDMVSYSAACYIGSFCHKRFAAHKMAATGSIGIKAEFRNMDKAYKEMGIEFIEVVPPESKWKNRATREAKEGNPDLLIKEELTPWAVHFQEVMRENIPDIDETVEGILEGRTFFAYDSVENGLVDGIKPMEEILNYAYNYAERQKLESF